MARFARSWPTLWPTARGSYSTQIGTGGGNILSAHCSCNISTATGCGIITTATAVAVITAPIAVTIPAGGGITIITAVAAIAKGNKAQLQY